MKLSCPGDYLLQEAWLKKHRDATEIIYDTENDLPVEARYRNPIYSAYIDNPRQIFEKVEELKNKASDDLDNKSTLTVPGF